MQYKEFQHLTSTSKYVVPHDQNNNKFNFLFRPSPSSWTSVWGWVGAVIPPLLQCLWDWMCILARSFTCDQLIYVGNPQIRKIDGHSWPSPLPWLIVVAAAGYTRSCLLKGRFCTGKDENNLWSFLILFLSIPMIRNIIAPLSFEKDCSWNNLRSLFLPILHIVWGVTNAD